MDWSAGLQTEWVWMDVNTTHQPIVAFSRAVWHRQYCSTLVLESTHSGLYHSHCCLKVAWWPFCFLVCYGDLLRIVMVSPSGTPALFPWMSQPPSTYTPQQHGLESWFTNQVGAKGCQYHTLTYCGSLMLYGIGNIVQHWFTGINSLYSSLGSANWVIIGSVMACHLLSAKPLPEPMLIYCLTV